MGSEMMELMLAEDSPYGRKGQTIKLALTPGDVHVAEEMSTVFLGYRPFPFRAEEACPVLPVDNDEDYYRIFSSDNAFKLVNVETSLEGAIREIDPSSSTSTYKLGYQAVGSFIGEITQMNEQKLYRSRVAAVKRCGWAMQLDHEYKVFQTYLGTLASWATTNRDTLTAATKWNDGASSDPLGNIEDMLVASLQPVTGIWMNQKVAFTFLNHPKVKDHIGLSASKIEALTSQVVRAGETQTDFTLPGYPPFHVVASKYYNETTATHDYVLGNHCVLTVTPPGGVPVSGEEIATLYTFRRAGLAGTGYETREYFDPSRGPRGGTMVVVSRGQAIKITGNNCGGFLQNVYQ